MKLPFKSLNYSLAQQALVAGQGMVGFFFLAAMRTPEDFGNWVLFSTVAAILEIARGGLIQNGFIFYFHNPAQDHQTLAATAWQISMGFSGLAVLGLLGAAFFLPGLSETLRALLGCYALVSLSLVPFFHILQHALARGDFRVVFWVYALRQSTIFLSTLAVAWWGLPLWYIVLAMALGSLLPLLFFAEPLCRKSLFRIDRESWGNLIGYGKKSMLTNGMGMLANSTDRFFLAQFSGMHQLALYAVFGKLSQITEVLVSAVARVNFTESCRQGKEGAAQLFLKRSVQLLLLVLPLYLASVFLGPVVLPLLTKGLYRAEAWQLAIVLMPVLLMPLYRQYGVYLDSTGRPQENARNVGLLLVGNLVLNSFLVPWLGFLGASLSTFLCLSALSAYALFTIRKTLAETVAGWSLKSLLT